MKFALLLVAICLVISMASGLNNTGRRLVNRPKFDIYGPRDKRSPDDETKGSRVKVHPLFQFPRKKPEPSLRKGEYICGNRVCKLQPGIEPKNCNGVCQYPI